MPGAGSVRIADASRILAIGGDVTEIVYALGAGARVVGVDTTSQFPPQALKEKKNVGYMRALSSEGVISVDATLILASERSGPPEVVKTLKTTSVPYVEIPDQHSAAGHRRQGAADRARDRRRGRGRARGGAGRGRLQAAGRAHRQDQAAAAGPVRAGRAERPRQWSAARTPAPMPSCGSPAPRTWPTAVNGFRPLPDEAIVELAPEVIVTHAPQLRQRRPRHRRSCSRSRASQSTPAGASKRIVIMDGLYLLGFGPRAPAAARELMGQLYPDLAGGDAGATR